MESVDSLRRVGKLPLAEIIDPLGVLFRFKMELYSMHEMCLARNFKGSPHDRALPWDDRSRRQHGWGPFRSWPDHRWEGEALKVLCRKACWYIRPEGGEGPSF